MPFSQAIGVLIIRLWAIGLVPYVLTGILEWLPQLIDRSLNGTAMMIYISYFVIGTSAIIGFVYARPLTSALVKFDKNEVVTVTVNADDLVVSGSFLIGLFFLLSHFGGAVSATTTLIVQLVERQPAAEWHASERLIMTLLGDWGQIIIAAFFVFQPRQIAALFHWLRTAGQAAAEASE